MSRTVIRFTPAERWFHNSVMFSFVLLLVTGLTMAYFNLKGGDREAHAFLTEIHEIAGVLFIAVPLVLFLTAKKGIWAENWSVIRHFNRTDIVWLMKKPVSSFKRGIDLPEEDKFNPGQKMWIYIALGGSFILTTTGIYIWLNHSAILALFAHTATALFITPALLGHMFMALVNPETRPGVTAIIDGEVDAEWAMEHHPLWMERHAKERVAATARHDRVLGEEDDPPTERDL